MSNFFFGIRFRDAQPVALMIRPKFIQLVLARGESRHVLRRNVANNNTASMETQILTSALCQPALSRKRAHSRAQAASSGAANSAPGAGFYPMMPLGRPFVWPRCASKLGRDAFASVHTMTNGKKIRNCTLERCACRVSAHTTALWDLKVKDVSQWKDVY